MEGASQLLSVFTPMEGNTMSGETHQALGTQYNLVGGGGFSFTTSHQSPTLVDAFGRRKDGADQRSNLPWQSVWVQTPQGRSTLDKQTKSNRVTSYIMHDHSPQTQKVIKNKESI